jgi:hypothetical protein
MTRKTAPVLFAVLLLLAACGEEDGVNDVSARDFTGSYTLVSFSQGTAAGVIPVPGATGTFTMTATEYQASVSLPQLPPNPPIVVDDEGTYSAVGSPASGTWTQNSTLDVNLQYAGTYSYDMAADRLTLDTTAQGVRSLLVLQKT